MSIWVYKYRYWDAELELLATSSQYFTLESIKSGLGMAIIESGIKVTLEDIDDRGRLRSHSAAGTRPYAGAHPSPGRSS